MLLKNRIKRINKKLAHFDRAGPHWQLEPG